MGKCSDPEAATSGVLGMMFRIVPCTTASDFAIRSETEADNGLVGCRSLIKLVNRDDVGLANLCITDRRGNGCNSAGWEQPAVPVFNWLDTIRIFACRIIDELSVFVAHILAPGLLRIS